MKRQLRYALARLLPNQHFRRLAVGGAFLFCLIQPVIAQQWSMLGSEGQISSVASFYTSITVANDVPYVVYVEGNASGGIGKVKRRNATSGAWEQVGGNLSATAISYTRIYSDNTGKLYVTFIDNSNSSKLAVLTFNTTSQAWEPLSVGNLYVSPGSATYTAGISTTRSGLAFDGNNVPYVTYSDRSSSTGYAFVKRFQSGVWETVGTGAVSTDFAASTNLALDNTDVPYVVYTQQATATSGTGAIRLFRLNTTTNAWENVSPPSPVPPATGNPGATTAVRHTSIAMDSSNNPVVAYFNTSSNNKSTIIRFNKTTAVWNWMGAPSTRDANNNSIINDNGGNVYNMFSDVLTNNGTYSNVRVFKLSKGAAALAELKNPTFTQGIDSTGPNSTATRPTTIANLNIAVGSDTSKPFIVYTKTNSGGIITPIVQMFSKPVVTKPATNITTTTATVGGEISSDGVSTITERGIVYGTGLNPTMADTKIADASGGTGSYTTNLTGLVMATGYHVRAYSISSTGTITYGSDVAFATLAPSPNSVTLIDNGTTVVLNNGIVKATIAKANAAVTSLIYNGIELISGGFSGGSVYWSWNMPNYQQPSNCTYTLTTDPHSNNFDYAEIRLRMTWSGSASTAAMDVDVYYSLPKNASGLYASATLSHPAAYPALPGGEWRMASYPNPRFDWLSVDSLRNLVVANYTDQSNSVAVPGAPIEVTRLTTGAFVNKYECKYDYSADFGDVNVWGWSSTADKVGLWVTAPSKEYYSGGPKKRELMCHVTPVMLNMLGGTHFGQGQETAVASGEVWEKTFGPFLLYCNKVPSNTANANIALWNDAKAQAATEQATWPYTWYTNPSYIQATGRGTVTGKLVITDAGNPTASPADTWVGVAIPPTGTSSATAFQTWSKNYQFWVKTDAAGNFTIPHVLPGTYSLFAFGPGAIGQLSLANVATVTAGATTALGNVNWTPARVASTVWEIGIPDRNAAEFRHGTDYWTSNTYPDTRWGKFLNYPDEFPSDVNFTIGQSNIATDWNYAHYWDKNVRAASPAWKVNFNLATAPTTGSTASVYVGLAEMKSAALILTVNGTNVTTPATGISFNNNSNSLVRKGIHGAFNEVRFDFPAGYLQAGANQISFTIRVTGSETLGNVMYDYVRLEAAGTNLVVLPMELLPLKGTKKEKTNVLNWATTSELNTTDFQVLRGNIPNPTEVVGSVKARGTSTVYTPYSFTDNAPLAGANYYRLKMVDKDGKTTYSNIVLLKATDNAEIMVYPNPVSSQLLVRSTSGATIGSIKLYDAKGSIVYAKSKIAAVQTTVNVASLPTGIYTVEVQSGDKVSIQKVQKQ